MTNAMCLKCASYQFIDTPFIDGRIQHPRLTWKCIKGLHPLDCQDEKGNVVCDDCIDFKGRVAIR